MQKEDDVSIKLKKKRLFDKKYYIATKRITVNNINRIWKYIFDNRRKILPVNPKSVDEVHQTVNAINVEKK